MKISGYWLLLLATGSLLWACGGGSSDSGSSTQTSSCNSTPPEGTDSAACQACVQKSCSSQYSAFCGANCDADAQSSACQKATADLGSCGFSSCLSDCDTSDDAGGASGKASSGGASSGPGNISMACYVAEMHSCTVFTVPESQRELVESQCSSSGGIGSGACPSKALVGCCTFGGGTVKTCGYDADQASITEEACTQVSGSWTTTP